MLKNFCYAALLLLLTSCGAVYHSPVVSDADDKVRVISLNAQTVLAANRSKYRPKQLPAVFYQTTGGSGMRGIGALPQPVYDQQTRPAALAMRLPPNTPAEPYQIGVGDVLILATPSSSNTIEQLSGLLAAQNRRQGYTVQDDGAIAIPDVGRVQIAGLTLEEAENELFQRLVQNNIDPSFSLEIAEFNSKRVSIGGAVAKPTVASLTLAPLYLDQALAGAGGITTPDADFASIRLYREGALYQIPLNEYQRRPDIQKLRLADGDSIFVDTEYELKKAEAYFSEQIALAQFRASARAQALAELQTEVSLRRAALAEARSNYQAQLDLDAVDRDYVYLTGEVTNPSRFTMPFGRQATLADALYDSGGFSANTADPGQIYVLRASDNPAEFGAVTAWHLNARNVTQMTVATRMELRPNDVIFIAAQPVTKWNRALQQMMPSLILTAASQVAN